MTPMADIALDTILAGALPVPRPQRGVYFLLHNGRVVYVGQATSNAYRRVGEHIKSKEIDAYYCHEFSGTDAELTALERRLIDAFDPPLNRQKKFWQNIPEGGGHPSTATKRTLALIDKGYTPYAAAKKTGIALSTIYRAIKRQRTPSSTGLG